MNGPDPGWQRTAGKLREVPSRQPNGLRIGGAAAIGWWATTRNAPAPELIKSIRQRVPR
ncbi:hypothetical protein GCM10010169_63520 [Micromonospora fulviviridis]|nr:hypothetical protein GCM10010169_63520 [Micromonospora fulviviridis]